MTHPLVRFLLFLCITLLVEILGSGARSPALAADCGGSVPCECGDRVVADKILGAGDPITSTVCVGNGLEVVTGVVLDLGFSTLRGVGDSSDPFNPRVGILVQDASDVTIKRGKIVGFDFGVFGFSPIGGAGVTTSRVSGLQVLDSLMDGIHLEGGGNVIEANVVRRTKEGATAILVSQTPGGDANIVRLNRVEDNSGLGILVLGDGSLVSRNIALRNTGRGFEFDGTNVRVDRNRAEFNGDLGFGIFGTGVIASQNIATGNGRGLGEGKDGIGVACVECRFDRNRSFYNVGFGINEAGGAPDTNVYTNNLCGGNGLGDSSPSGLCR